jgi:hypothetical protein
LIFDQYGRCAEQFRLYGRGTYIHCSDVTVSRKQLQTCDIEGSVVFLGNQTVPQLVKRFTDFYGNGRFITVFTTAGQFFLA